MLVSQTLTPPRSKLQSRWLHLIGVSSVRSAAEKTVMQGFYLVKEDKMIQLSDDSTLTMCGCTHSNVFLRGPKGVLVRDLIAPSYLRGGDKLVDGDREWLTADTQPAAAKAEQVPAASSVRRVKYACTNSDYCYVLTENNFLYRIDYAGTCQLLSEFQKEDRVYIAADDHNCRAIVNNWLMGKDNKEKLYAFASEPKSFVAGKDFFVVLLDDGTVFTFGTGLRGQLGVGTLIAHDLPVRVAFDEQDGGDTIKIDRIACGGWHVCARDQSGSVFTWGWNSNGQTGIEESLNGVQTNPLELDDLGTSSVQSFTAGSRHTCLLLDDGRSVLFGCNTMGQCGLPSCEQVALKEQMDRARRLPFKHVYCSQMYTVCF